MNQTIDEQASRADGPILRCLRLIRLLTETKGDLSIKEAARHLGLPTSTTHRLLQILQQEGFAAKDPTTLRYRTGLDLERMGALLTGRRGLRDLVRPYLQDVVNRCGEACMFVAYLPATQQVSVLAAINSSHPLRYEIVLNEPHSLVWGATGRSICAFLPETQQRAAAEAAQPSPVTGEPLPPWPLLKAELDRIQAQGYVVTRSQKLEGAVGIGSPIRDAAGAVIGSFCITVPEIRFDQGSERELAELVRQQAQAFGEENRL